MNAGAAPDPRGMDGVQAGYRRRYRRILTFFGGIIAHLVWWDVVLRRVPLWGEQALQSRPERWRLLSRRFRQIAVEMGGVLIKLGQFLSARVDVLPPEITEELQGLQDEVPPVPSEQIFATLRRELGDLSTRFARVEEQPIAAASLGQVHRAWLLPQNGVGELGEAVVIKVLRPYIEEIVRTDLAALRVVARWVRRYKPIRRRADAPALMEEFAATLWEELDYHSEADNAERFAEIFADSERVYIPAVYRRHSTGHVLVLEDVTAIKITDVDGMIAAGVDPADVADQVMDAYFYQIFREGFFHADPHPGNLFVRPREDLPWTPAEAGQLGRPFWLIFVDFGMVGRVPHLTGENLRKVLISVTQRDARQLTEAYNDLGFFLPGADLERIIEAQELVLNRIYGRKLLDLARPDPAEMQELGQEFRDLLYDFPFQVPQDFVYLGRAMGMVSGLVSQLNPEINPWYHLERYGRELVAGRQARDFSAEAVLEAVRPYLELPGRLQRLVKAAEGGNLRVQTRYDRDSQRRLDRLERRLGQLSWSFLGAAGLISATLMYLRRRDGRD